MCSVLCYNVPAFSDTGFVARQSFVGTLFCHGNYKLSWSFVGTEGVRDLNIVWGPRVVQVWTKGRGVKKIHLLHTTPRPQHIHTQTYTKLMDCTLKIHLTYFQSHIMAKTKQKSAITGETFTNLKLNTMMM